MQRIPLRDRSGAIVAHALVDDDDYERIAALRWHRHVPATRSYAYARHCTGVYMHRLVLGIPKGDPLIVDHINRNGLDNRKANLRSGTQLANMQNRATPSGSRSIHRGVTYDARPQPLAKRWIAGVKEDGRYVFFKRFATEAEAATAATEARLRFLPLSHCNT